MLHRRARVVCLWATLAWLALPTAVARAENAPSPDRLKAAAEEFDLGRRAYIARDWEQAAVHFENAHRDAPRAETLRLAIRARREAKQLARAATLAAAYESTYAGDAATAQLVRETLAEASPLLHEYDVQCSVTCTVAADGRLAAEVEASQHRIFVEPGPHDLGVGFVERPSVMRRVEAVRGGKDTFVVEAPPRAPAAPAPVGTSTAPAEAPRTKPLGPAVFFVGVGLTAAGAAATVWSGIDTLRSPGRDAVRDACAGRDATCPPYAEGQEKELRTNILLGATVGVAVVTGVIGVFFTQWSRPPATATRATPHTLGAAPAFLPGGGGASVHGTF